MTDWWEHAHGITADGVRAWLAQRLGEVPEDHPVRPWALVCGPKMPDTPHRVSVITPAGGPGLRMEGLMDARVFQIRTRGAGASPSGSDTGDAEAMAHLVDAALLSAHMPTIGGVHTLGWDRSGAPPTPEDDAGNRTVMTCNYVTTVASVLAE